MTIEQRVEKLERQNKWMKRAWGLALAGVACVVLMGQGKAKALPDLVVRSLTVRDGAGKARADLRTTADGACMLRLFDKAGEVRVGLITISDGTPSLSLRDKTGKTRADLSLFGGPPALDLYDKAGALRAALGVTTTVNKVTEAETKTAESTLTLFDSKGNVLWQAPR